LTDKIQIRWMYNLYRHHPHNSKPSEYQSSSPAKRTWSWYRSK